MDYSEDEMGRDDEDYEDDVIITYDLFYDEEAEKKKRRDKEENKDKIKMKQKSAENLKKKRKKKRTVKGPRVTLNVDTLKGPNGLSALKKLFANFKFKGTNHELEDLTRIIQVLQQWMCFKVNPGYNFESTMTKFESLGERRAVQTLMKKYRLGIEDWGDNDEVVRQYEIVVDHSYDFARELQELIDNANSDEFTDEENFYSAKNNVAQQGQVEVVLTQEQLERIAKNRKMAEERRNKRLSAQNKVNVSTKGYQNKKN